MMSRRLNSSVASTRSVLSPSLRDLFWSLTLDDKSRSGSWSGIQNPKDQEVGEPHERALLIRNVLVGADGAGERHVVKIETSKAENSFEVVILPPNTNINLDLDFGDETIVKFELVKGSGPVYCVGNQILGDVMDEACETENSDDDGEDDEDDDGEEGKMEGKEGMEEDEDEDDESSENSPLKVQKKRKLSSQPDRQAKKKAALKEVNIKDDEDGDESDDDDYVPKPKEKKGVEKKKNGKEKKVQKSKAKK